METFCKEAHNSLLAELCQAGELLAGHLEQYPHSERIAALRLLNEALVKLLQLQDRQAISPGPNHAERQIVNTLRRRALSETTRFRDLQKLTR